MTLLSITTVIAPIEGLNSDLASRLACITFHAMHESTEVRSAAIRSLAIEHALIRIVGRT